MNSNSIVKKDLLRRKINEYFTKHPNAKSVIIETDIGENKTVWRVVRENRNFSITEVNTSRENFIMELGGAQNANIEDPVGVAALGDVGKSIENSINQPAPKATMGLKNAQNSIRAAQKNPNVKKNVHLSQDLTNADKMLQNLMKSKQAASIPASSLNMSNKRQGKMIKEVSKAYADVSNAFMDAFGDEAKMAQVRKQAEQAANDPQIKNNPDERKKLGAIIGMLTGEGDRMANVAGKGAVRVQGSGKPTGGFSSEIKEAVDPTIQIMKIITKNMRGLENDPKVRIQVANQLIPLIKQINHVEKQKVMNFLVTKLNFNKAECKTLGLLEHKVIKEAGEEEDTNLKQLPPTGGNEEQSDVQGKQPEEDSEDKEVEDEIGPETEELASIQRTLKGATIDDINLELTPSGAKLLIQVVGTPTPAELAWSKTGKIVYTFKGTPYIIRKD